MSTNIVWHWDVAIVHDTIDLIAKAQHDPMSRIRCRKKLEDARDELHQACQEFERNGMCEECEEAYYCLFDALSHLTEALRGRAVLERHLGMAKSALHQFLNCEVQS